MLVSFPNIFFKVILPSPLGNLGADPESLGSDPLTYLQAQWQTTSDREDRDGKHCLISNWLCPFRFLKKSAKKNKCAQTSLHPTVQMGDRGPPLWKLPGFPVGTMSVIWANSRMPATFHLWTFLGRYMPTWEWPREPRQHGFQSNKIWSPGDTGTKLVMTITGITEGLLCARNLRILYSSVSSLWGRDHYLHLIDEEAQVQQS